MASWMYSGVNAGFKVNEYVPLSANRGEIFTTPFHVVVDYEYSYYSTLYQSQNTTNVHFECDLTGYAGTIDSESKYPALVCYLSNGTFGSEQCGVRVATENYYSANVSGTDNTNGVITNITTGYYGGAFNGAWTQNGEITVHASNIPIIFEDADVQTMGQYLWRVNNTGSGGNLQTYNPDVSPATTNVFETAINYQESSIFDENTNEFYINNQYNSYTVERGIVSNPGQATYIRAERILYNGTQVCFYRDDSNPFELTLLTGGNLVGSLFSNSSYQELLEKGYDEFTLDTLEYSGPFYSPYKSDLGVSDYDGYLATVWATNIPIWDSFAKAQQYINGLIDASEAENWDRISGDGAYKNIIDNLTEEPEEETEFGEVYVRNIFSQLYLCNTTSLYEISNALFDYDVTTLTGIWEDIKKGIEMYGSNPIDCVQGLRFYPFDLTSIFTQVQSQNYVYFGAYKLELQNSSVYKMIYANGYKDLGSVTIKRTFKDWRDFEPYTKLSIYLPYVGRYQLDLKKYYDKTVNIRYYLDLRTGACIACLIANGVLLDWFDGIIGTEMPISLTDYSSYAQNQLNIIMRNAGISGGSASFVGNKGMSIAHRQRVIQQDYMEAANNQYNSGFAESANYQMASSGSMDLTVASQAGNAAAAGSTAAASKAGVMAGVGVAGAAVGAAGAAAIVGMKTAFDLMRGGTAGYTSTRAGSSAMINQFLPQYPTFMFEVLEIDETEYLNELYGRPTNASGRLGDFSGYLEAEDIMLICPIATDNEREEIINLVKSGIYI